jgi:class 3 adenylate cyclase
VRELDDQSNTFNSMVGALKWFQAYVPKPLVQQLIREGDLSALESDERHLTVMFTDIAGYSTISEGKGAAEIAELLNQHFTIVAGAVEAESGTVDKFIGDSVMAFWGAPEKQKHRAIRACRAALTIRDGIAADNKMRVARGEPPVRMRIGVHSGEATVGNIGPPDRVNYTVIGDDVNVAQRLEQLGKEVSPDDEVAILISAATVEDLDEGFTTEPAGDLAVKGRDAPVEVYRLMDGPRAGQDHAT